MREVKALVRFIRLTTNASPRKGANEEATKVLLSSRPLAVKKSGRKQSDGVEYHSCGFESRLLHSSQIQIIMTKYNNIKCNGYDSIREYNRAKTLKLLAKQGIISNLEEQVKYELVPSQKGKGMKVIERAVHYIADFQYTKDGETIVEDSKGVKTKDYIIKRKLMLYVYGIRVNEV